MFKLKYKLKLKDEYIKRLKTAKYLNKRFMLNNRQRSTLVDYDPIRDTYRRTLNTSDNTISSWCYSTEELDKNFHSKGWTLLDELE